MEKCRFNGKAIYAFNVSGKNETINNNIEKTWRKAGEQNQLICDECEAPVFLRWGTIYKPHFAHKSDMQGGNTCSYSSETEEHIEGKKILLKYMENLYPNVYAEIRYKLPERRKADLYFRFNDGRELVIEFQRQRLSVSYWDEKREFYKKLGLNNVWFLSGKSEQLDSLVREYQLSFWNRMVLNDSDNMILFLDFEAEAITLIKKITIFDEEINEIVYDNLFSRTYLLNDMRILPDGKIECAFDEGFNKEKDKFVQAFLEQKRRELEEKERIKRVLEEQEKKRKEDREKILKEQNERIELLAKQKDFKSDMDDKTDVFSEIGYSRNNYSPNSNKSYPKKNYNDFKKDENYYKQKVNKAILGYNYGFENLVRDLRNGGFDDYTIVNKIFVEQINSGNTRAKKVLEEVMKKAGLD